MVRIRLERAATLITTVIGLAAAGACGGSPPTAPNQPPPPPPPPGVSFASDNPNPDDNAVILVMTASGPDSFTLTLNAISVIDFFGYALDIVFDPTILELESSQFGTFLDGDGITVTSQITEIPAGTLVAGHSRVGAVAGATGTGTLLVLNFNALTAGSMTTIAIENAGASDSTGAMLAPEFIGGTVTVPPSAQ